MNLTDMQLRAIIPRARADTIAAWIGPLRDAMTGNAIDTTPQRMAGFLASVANETGQLSATDEASYFGTPYERIAAVFGIAAPSQAQIAQWRSLGRERFDVEFFNWVYDDANRGPYTLGNDQPGDGWKYRGRGPGQITGKRNYRAVFRRMGLPEDSDPDLLLDPAQGAMAFGGYWRAAGNNERMDRGAFEDAMRIMNSGLKDFAPHKANYDRALKVLNAPEPKPAPATTMAAAKQAASGKTGKALIIAAATGSMSAAEAITKVNEATTLATAGKGFLGIYGLPENIVSIVLGVVTLLAIGFVFWRYGYKLLRGEAVST
jgi:putative chitinase